MPTIQGPIVTYHACLTNDVPQVNEVDGQLIFTTDKSGIYYDLAYPSGATPTRLKLIQTRFVTSSPASPELETLYINIVDKTISIYVDVGSPAVRTQIILSANSAATWQPMA